MARAIVIHEICCVL